MRPQQRVVIYRNGLPKNNKNQKQYEANQARFAKSDAYRACSHCNTYVRVAASGNLYGHKMGIGVNAIQCLNPIVL
jgi:hypothetical protein